MLLDICLMNLPKSTWIDPSYMDDGRVLACRPLKPAPSSLPFLAHFRGDKCYWCSCLFFLPSLKGAMRECGLTEETLIVFSCRGKWSSLKRDYCHECGETVHWMGHVLGCSKDVVSNCLRSGIYIRVCGEEIVGQANANWCKYLTKVLISAGNDR